VWGGVDLVQWLRLAGAHPSQRQGRLPGGSGPVPRPGTFHAPLPRSHRCSAAQNGQLAFQLGARHGIGQVLTMPRFFAYPPTDVGLVLIAGRLYPAAAR